MGGARAQAQAGSGPYQGARVSYLQQGLLASDRLAVQLLGQRLLSAVFLVKALGGDWRDTKTALAQ